MKILFLGAGRMAGAMVKGLLSAGTCPANDLYCLCGPDDSGKTLSSQTGIHYLNDLNKAPPSIDCIVLACKPQQLCDLPAGLPGFSKDKLVLSILAGVTLFSLKKVLGTTRALVRIMPNTPAQIGQGISAYSSSVDLTESDSGFTKKILSAMGESIEVEECQMDAVTALSGSGPAYLFELVHALSVAGSVMGLDRDVSEKLARQTIIGSAALLSAREDASPEVLRNEVTSPGGTTEAALTKLAQLNHRGIWQEALLSAKKRSQELSQKT